MRKLLFVCLVILSCIFVAHSTYAGDHPTKKEVEAFIQGAIDFAKKNGKEAFLAEIVKPDGLFIKGELYIAAMSYDIKVIAHGAKPHIKGADMSRLTDKNGVNIGKAYMNAMKNGDGWCEYYWPNPVTKKIQKKLGYGIKFDDECWLLTGTYSND